MIPTYDFQQLNQQIRQQQQTQQYGGIYNSYGYGYSTPMVQPQQLLVFQNLLTTDEIARLQKKPIAFTTKLTEEEFLRSACTHKSESGEICFTACEDDKVYCPICQAKFHVIDPNESKEAIESICQNMYDLLQTIKTFYGNAPQAMKEFYMMAGYILKVPELWDIAKNYINKAFNNGTNMYASSSEPDQNAFFKLANIIGPNAINGVAPGSSYYGQPQNPMAYNPTQPVVPAGWAPVPQAAVLQTPQPPQQPVQQGWQPVQVQPQQPTYGYNAAQYTSPAPSANPIGYVADPNAQDFTASKTQPPLPEPPKNPNLQQNKAVVGKSFQG